MVERGALLPPSGDVRTHVAPPRPSSGVFVVRDVRRSGTAAIAGDFARTALQHAALCPRPLEDRAVGVRVDVDEARREAQAARVEHARGLHVAQRPDRRDALGPERHIGDERRRAASVEHVRAAQQHVEASARAARAAGESAEGQGGAAAQGGAAIDQRTSRAHAKNSVRGCAPSPGAGRTSSAPLSSAKPPRNGSSARSRLPSRSR